MGRGHDDMNISRIGKVSGVMGVVAAGLPLTLGILAVSDSPASASGTIATVGVPGPLPAATLGRRYEVRLIGGGGSSYRLAQRGALPKGINLHSGGLLSGKPKKKDLQGVYAFTVQNGSHIFSETLTLVAATGGNCTNPVWSSSKSKWTYSIGSNNGQYWSVNNDTWSGSHGPQTIHVCNQASWYAVSDQPNIGGAVETYPDTEYDIRNQNSPSTKPVSRYNSISSTFSEDYPSAGSWDAAYDLWLNNWSIETMIWNQWSGTQDYLPDKATISLSLGGVPYKFYDNGGELMFFRQNQVTSGSVDILAAYDWLVQKGYVSANDAPTQLEYGVEICSTNGNETFPMTGLTFKTS
jgi:hypothetical protein